MVGWRVNDIVAYDTMQERLTALNACLLQQLRRLPDSHDQQQLRDEMSLWREGYLAVDGHDRDRILAFTAQLEQRLTELTPGEQ